MKIRNQFAYTALVICLSSLVLSCKDNSYQAKETNVVLEETSTENTIAQGKYLVEILGCNDCHSPKRMGERGPEIIPELLLSGYPSDRPVITLDAKLIEQGFGIFYPDMTAAAGPWGLTFAANLTPDDTGIGTWTEEQFKKALTQGKYKGLDNGRMLLPPMPWRNYSKMKEADVHAIYTYLKSIKPVENTIPAPIAANDIQQANP